MKSLDEIDENKIAESVDYDTLMAVFTEWFGEGVASLVGG